LVSQKNVKLKAIKSYKHVNPCFHLFIRVHFIYMLNTHSTHTHYTREVVLTH